MMNKLMGKLAQRALTGFGALALLGLLASCGGGTEQVTPFEPTRLLAFGDEMSVLTKLPPQGRKYSVNALVSDGTGLDCTARPLWTQIVASRFGFSFEECNSSILAVNEAKMLAEPGAKSDDLPAQIERARLLTGCFNETDLVTLLIGANDVIDLYENVYLKDPTTQTATSITNELTRRGALLGQRINSLTRLGPKVIVSTIPLMNLTPYALRQPEVLNARSVLRDFSNAFNTAMRVNIVNDGRFIGLVELDAILNAGVTDPSRYGLTNVTNAVCAKELPDCNTSTLVPEGNATTWLWASGLWMGSTAHLNLGNFARGRAIENPFGSPSGSQCRPPPPPDS
jgi:outer membrane lipase/esterase